MKQKAFKYYMPKLTLIGVDAVKQLGPELKKRSIKKCLLVTDAFMVKSQMADYLRSLLSQSQIEAEIYSGVQANPTISQVNEGVQIFLDSQVDAIISLGGGSPHDCAKAIKLAIVQGNLVRDKKVLLAAINTTAGTASEVTRFAIITDEVQHYKLSIIHDEIIPDIAVDDPILMKDMPPKLTAATGMDALTHALEAYVAKDRTPITDCTALKAIQLIRKYLKKAYQSGEDMEARNGMVYAQYMAGMAFSNAGLGLVHAMAHQLGGLYNLPHGICNAVLLPYVITYNLDERYICYGYISKAVGISSDITSDYLASKALIRYIKQLRIDLEIPKSLKELGVKQEDCNQLAEMAMRDPSIHMNPVKTTKEDVQKLFLNAHKGLDF